nr:hypothetical protein [Tanacetum cinerariifolium]
EDLVPILSESEGIPDTMCDVHLVSNPTPLEAKDHVEIVINSNDDISSSDDDSLYKENIEYVEASPHDSELVSLEVAEIVIPKVEEIEDDNLREKLLNVHLLIAEIEALKDNHTPSSDLLTKSSSTPPKSFLEETNTFHNSLPEFENFYFDLEEISSGSTTTHSDISLSEYDSFIFDLSKDQFPPTDRSDFSHEEFVDELAHIISPPKVFKIKDAFGNKQYKPEDVQELFRELFNDVQNIYEELAKYINTPGWNRPAFYNNGEDDDEDYAIAITPDFLITDSLIMGEEHLDTIPEKELDEFIKSSVENLVSNPNLDSTLKNNRFDTKSYLIESLLNRDESIPPGIDSDDSDSEEDNLFLERLLHDDPIPFSGTLDFSNVVRVFLLFFTYPVTSSILLSSGSEDTIFDPGIYHFSSLDPGVSHRSRTFMKFNIYPNHLNESPMEILYSTCSPMDQ